MHFRHLLKFSLIIVVFMPLVVAAATTPLHLDPQIMADGCGSCHVGFDFTNGGGSAKCITCHGPASGIPKSLISMGNQFKDVTRDFAKNYRHPVFGKAGNHSAREVLPETNPVAPRHVECADCHSPHYVSRDNPYAGLRGKKVGNFASPITKEYELCYLCHADSANLPVKSTNKRIEFNKENPSFHPVEAEGKNQAVVSLMRPYREKKTTANDVSTLKCADCHGSDDPNSPQGPHGSKYEGLLVDNYATGDGIQENAYAYGLCYRCHKRTSIMGNQSFPLHSRHIAGENNFKGGGTSCHTCHTSHGSPENRYLIRFNRNVVKENSEGKLKFVEKGTYSFHGECWLNCHGVDHNPKTY
ncbi:cytochrome c3 family protein [Geobacter chapellei]|uniref:nitrite reductase (cytochrome; ammonia-forming) n=2 Tax=Pelotalea chapellei TaxID=44671 RepID=A0ABS5U6Z8_9BACT|nr:cytochrome c3 family protein [Pelotalea chapellei]